MMNSILICLFVFILGSLAAKVPTDVDKNEAPDRENVESLQDFPGASRDDSFVTKRSAGKTGRWQKANSSPVCFGARNNHFGRFYAPSRGKLAAVKLVHLYGFVSCLTGKALHWSYWGCGNLAVVRNHICVVITTSNNHILLPPSQFFNFRSGAGRWSQILGYNSYSPEIILSFFSHPYWVYSGQQLRVWYGEDWDNYTEIDNGGRVCCDVYALYV